MLIKVSVRVGSGWILQCFTMRGCTPFVFVFSVSVDAHEQGSSFTDSPEAQIEKLCWYLSSAPNCTLKLANKVILFHAQAVNSYPPQIKSIYFQTS